MIISFTQYREKEQQNRAGQQSTENLPNAPEEINKSSGRNQNLDALRGLGILLVMLGHCIVLNQMEDGIIYDGIKAIQMPLFMIASGFTAGMMKKMKSLSLLGHKILKRATTYLLPFLSWLLLLHWDRFPQEFFDTLFQLDRGLWFLATLFILTMVMYLAMAVRDMTPLGKAGFLGVWLIAGLTVLWQNHMGNHFLSPHLTLYYMPFYFLGYLLHGTYRIYCIHLWKNRKNFVSVKRTIRNQVPVAVLITLLGCFFAYLIVAFDMIVANNKIELMAQMMASLCGSFLCIVLIHMMRDGKVKEFLAFVGNYTLEIYVIHYHFAQILGMAGKHLSLYTWEGAGVVVLTFAIMCILTTISIVLLKQFWITNLLLFGKNQKAGKSLVDRVLGRV